jgi:glycosyltransferase involved in cell wall biosynthesis
VLHVLNDVIVGGAQRVVLDYSVALDRESFACEVASLELIAGGELGTEFEAAGIPLRRLRLAHEPWPVAIGRLDAWIARVQPDVVHTHLALAGVVGRSLARRRRVPRIMTTLHNLSDWEERHSSLLRLLDRHTMAWADVVIAVSDAVRRAAQQRLPMLESRIVTVPNGVRIEALAGVANERAAARSRLGLPQDAFVVGSVARLDARKGLDTLLEAAGRIASTLPNLHVLIVGRGPERARLEALAKHVGLGARTHLPSSPPAVRDALAAMDVFAAPSRTEGLGLAVIEALAAGVPVLAAHVGGLPEVVLDGICGRLLLPDAPDVWAQAIVSAAADPDQRRQWAAGAANRARQFDLRDSVRAIEHLYVDRAAHLRAA